MEKNIFEESKKALSKFNSLDNKYFIMEKKELLDPSLSESMPSDEYKIFCKLILNEFNENNEIFKTAEDKKTKIDALNKMIECLYKMHGKKSRWGKYTVWRTELRKMCELAEKYSLEFKPKK